MRGRTTVLTWVVTRLLVVVALMTYANKASGDVNYFRHSLDLLSRLGVAHTLPEYPLPAVGVLMLPWSITHSLGSADLLFGMAVLLLALMTDGIFFWVLWRSSAGRAEGGVAIWLLAVPALGAVTITRFDILPGVLVGLTILAHRRWPRTAGSLVAVATCVKLWPALLIAPLVAAQRRRSWFLGPVLVIGTLAVIVIIAVAGWPRLLSPLTYQADRGLQIESVAATPAMIAWGFGVPQYGLWLAPSRSWEVTGPGVNGLLSLTWVLTAVFGVFLVVTWWRALARRRPIDHEALVWLVLTATTGFIDLGRVLSPQYLLWLAPAIAAGLCVSPPSKKLHRWGVLLVVAMVLTQLIFPTLYPWLLDGGVGAMPAVIVLGIRNGLLLWLVVVGARESWFLTGRPDNGGASFDQQIPQPTGRIAP